jgi:ankyrin repeat protein
MKRVILVALLGLSSLVQAQTLVELVEQSEFAAAMELLSSGVDVNQPSSDGTTALHWAAYHGNVDLAKRLLRAEAVPNTHNDYGSSPMMEAAVKADIAMLELLLDAGADVESPNTEGQTALMAVARTGNLEAAKLLVRKGANVNAAEKWGGQTALMWAAARKHPQMVDFLIEEGAGVDERAIDRNWERRVTSEPRVKEMFTGGFTPLLYAVREDCLECVKKLLAAGADINKPDPDNISPLVLALLNMRFDIAKYLVEQGADVNQWDYWGRTPLYAAADLNILPASARGDIQPIQNTTGLEVARMLLERGANPDYALKLSPPPRQIYNDRAGDNPVMTTGSTPLQRAAYGADVDMMKLLLEFKADIHHGNVLGVTPLIAMTNGGGSRNRNKNEQTVMEGLQLLIDAGLDINQAGGVTAETPLHTTARLNWLEVTRFLVKNGANLYARDARGLLPIDYATGKADTESFGNFNVVGELPEMAALLQSLMDAAPQAIPQEAQ